MRDLAIRSTHPNVVVVNGGTEALDKNGNVVVLDESAITIATNLLQAEYDALEYARNRASEYPSLLELTVALYDTDDKSAVEAKRAEVKAKYPKPS